MKGDITLVESAQTLRVGPVDRRIVSILTSIIPAHPVVRPGALFVTNCHSDAGGKGISALLRLRISEGHPRFRRFAQLGADVRGQ